MKKNVLFTLLFLIFGLIQGQAQHDFSYEVQLTPVSVENFEGLHSFVIGQHEGKWLLIGGRTDGLHPRQPFASFSAAGQNVTAYVIDVNAGKSWQSDLASLSTSIQEQLASTNMNFTQVGDSLYIIGGYGYSSTAGDHITYPNLTVVQIDSMIAAIQNGSSLSSWVTQTTDTIFAVTGGQLIQHEDTFYLVGGHKFTGRYNPMGHHTYTQYYTNEIRKYSISSNSSGITYTVHNPLTDKSYLHRRDYNLIPQVFTNGEDGYTLSSGVFQPTVDLPYLYPVDFSIKSGITAYTNFNQYLSNYHSAKVALYDGANKVNHAIFFGGMSQYYYDNGIQIKDDKVPFVKTISRLSRAADNSFKEFKMSTDMPGLKGASAEFVLVEGIPTSAHEMVLMDSFAQDTILIGHIVGGISSQSINPFSENRVDLTMADTTIFKVELVKTGNSSAADIDGSNPFEDYRITFENGQVVFEPGHNSDIHKAYYHITSLNGQVIKQDRLYVPNLRSSVDLDMATTVVVVTLLIDDRYTVVRRLLVD